MHFSIREIGFWTLDFLKGSPIRKQYDEIAHDKGDKTYEKIRNILEYAINNVPFYQNIRETDLNLFPVVNKKVYQENREKMYSVEFSNITSLYKAATSGSTGTPLIIYQDKIKRSRVRADLICAHEKIDWYLGDHFVFMRNWVKNYKQSQLKSISQNVQNINVCEFDDCKKEWLCKHLLKRKKSVIFGYSSSACDFMFFLQKNNIDAKKFKVKLIVCDSDELSIKNKRELEKVFACPVINRYDNEENGLLAISRPFEETMYINTSSLFVELLKLDSDEPVEPGELGRVVVTDFYNRSMPIIRYDIGDLAVSFDLPGHIKTFSELSGRKNDCVYSTKGIMISSVAISAIMEVFDSITKYQLIQKSKLDYLLKFIGNITKENEMDILKRLYNALGDNANIELMCVEDIPVEKNGKYKTLINNL